MSKEEKIKSLGFNNMDELLLYQDVCGTNSPTSAPESMEELLDRLRDDSNGYRKEETF